MNVGKALAVLMHLSPAQLIGVCVPPETDCQRDFCYLAGVSTVHCSVEHVQLHGVVHNQGADQIT
jgi:hypothetical protein